MLAASNSDHTWSVHRIARRLERYILRAFFFGTMLWHYNIVPAHWCLAMTFTISVCTRRVDADQLRAYSNVIAGCHLFWCLVMF